jgi:hypothetical protein
MDAPASPTWVEISTVIAATAALWALAFGIERVEAYVIDDTAFLPKHMREVLPLLEAEGSARIGALKSGGSTRRKNTYPNDAYITFQ